MSAVSSEVIPLELRQLGSKGRSGLLQQLEQWALTLLLLAMIALPLLDRVLYRLGAPSPPASLVAHLTLLLTMLGGLLAAGSQRLIATPVVLEHLPARARALAAATGKTIAALLCLQLALAAWHFVLAERSSSVELLPGLPLWQIEMCIPVGFVLIGARILLTGHGSARLQLFALLAAVAGAVLCTLPWDPAIGRTLGLVALGVALLCGAPMFTMIGGLALLLMWYTGQPTAAIAVKHYSLVTTPVIPTLPLFALTGYLLAESGAAARLVRVFAACFGPFRGGVATASVLACAFFTTFTGASGVTILALGGLLLPTLRSAGYRERDALGLITGSGSIGLLFPPCLPVILYSIVALQTLQGFDPDALQKYDVSIEGMFTAALLPGLLLVTLAILWGRWREPQRRHARAKMDWGEAGRALWAAKWELGLPVVAVGAMFGGWVSSPVQAAALTACYALVIETCVHRDLRLRVDLPRIGGECGLLTGGILLILATAMGLTSFLVTAQVPERLTLWVGAYIHSPLVFLLALNLALLVVGCLMDMYSAIVVIVPLIVPLGLQYGIDPVHLGVIFLVNLELGFLHPPVGINLFLASYRFNRPLGEIVWAVLPMIGVVGATVALVTYWPALTHWLPTLLAPGR
jgi:tripartite ATP-independent transporter DctM subunit